MVVGALMLLALAAVAVIIPRLLTVPIAIAAAWVAITLLVRAWRLRTGTALADSETSGA